MKKALKVIGAGTVMAGIVPQLFFHGKRQIVSDNKNRVQIISKKTVAINENEYYLSAMSNFPLYVKVYHVNKPKAVIQIVHGAMEHQGRYQNLISNLNQQGFAVIANDHRGHGRSITEKYSKGYMNGTKELLGDLELVTLFANQLYPDLPVYMFGHSMGSMLARVYLKKNDHRIEKLILTGTPFYNSMVGVGIVLARLISFYKGEKSISSLLNVLPEDSSWISNNVQHLQAIENDSLGMKHFTNAGNLTMFELNRDLKYPPKFKAKNPDLKILVLNGQDDKLITGGNEGIDDSISLLTKAGYSNIQIKQYPKMKHEIIHEIESNLVFEDINQFYLN